MFGKKLIVIMLAGAASLAMPAFSQSEDPGKNEVSVQAFGSFVKSTTSNGIENTAKTAEACWEVIVASWFATAWK
jgi:hypothetical protein